MVSANLTQKPKCPYFPGSDHYHSHSRPFTHTLFGSRYPSSIVSDAVLQPKLVSGKYASRYGAHQQSTKRESGMIRLFTAGVRTGLVAAMVAAAIPMMTFAQTDAPAIESVPAVP